MNASLTLQELAVQTRAALKIPEERSKGEYKTHVIIHSHVTISGTERAGHFVAASIYDVVCLCVLGRYRFVNKEV